MAAQSAIVGDDIIIQECIEGREFTVGVYRDRDGYYALPIAEIITQDGVLFDYSEKYETDGYNEVFADLPDELRNSLTIPGFTSGSLVPKMWKKAGKSEGEFIKMLSL